MGDMSVEPSMEDILSSIKRIIAEEGDGGTPMSPRIRRPARVQALPPIPGADGFGHDEILELSDPVRVDTEEEEDEPVHAEAAPEPILSQKAEKATRGPLEALSRMVVKPETPGSDSLEGMVREMLRPMLREWLDSHLPEMVEKMVAREIARITAQPRG